MQHHRHASCVSFAWEYDAGIQEWQRGVRRCEPNAPLDGVCVGAAADGFLYNVSHADVRHRCARDDRCVGYTRDPQKSRILPLASLHNRVNMVPGRVTYRKVDDYCGLPLGLGDGQRLHEAMRSWAAEAAFRLATERANTVRYLREHLGNLTQFSAQNRLATPRMPVLYLFSGADLLTARALSPGAPAYVLSSALPFGDARCFLYDECRGRALGKLFEFVMAWRSTQFAWTNTDFMNSWLKEKAPGTNTSLGVLPILLWSLAEANETVVSLERSPTSRHAAVLRTDRRTTVTYISLSFGRRANERGEDDWSRFLRADLATLDAALEGTADRSNPHGHRGKWLSVIKAAEGSWTLTSQPQFREWLFSQVWGAVHDETGVHPSVFSNASMQVRCFGNFGGLPRAYEALHIKDVRWPVSGTGESRRWDASGEVPRLCRLGRAGTLPDGECAVLRKVAAQSRDDYSRLCRGGTSLPLVFGYGVASPPASRGVLVVATRDLALSSARDPPFYMRPLRLDLGQVETGLGNELWALAGYLMLAKTRNHTLCLPPFTSNVHEAVGACDANPRKADAGKPCTRTKPLPFADVYDADAFIAGMARVGVRCVAAEACHDVPPTQESGWRYYKKVFSIERATKTWADAGHLHPLQPIVTQMYQSLRLAPAVEAMVGEVMERAQLRDDAFGCVHARMEDDTKHMGPPATTGGIPTLEQYLDAAAALSAEDAPAVLPVLVATSDPLPFTTHEARPGVRWVQSPLKTGMDSETVHSNVSISYFVASLVDFAICRRAKWFAGFHLSSFSRILAEYQSLDRGRGWTNVCPSGTRHFAATEKHLLYTNWTVCPVNCSALNIEPTMGVEGRKHPHHWSSFGWMAACL